jgi:hypothetical protein
VQPEGGARFELVGWTETGVPIISIEYGRFLMMTIGRAGNGLQLQFSDDRAAEVTFVDAESTLALEARRVLPPGQDPTAQAAPLLIHLYVTSGLVRLGMGDAPLEIQAPARRALFAADDDGGDAEFPKWITPEALDDYDRLAATTIEPLMRFDDRPIELTLKELATHRRREVRSLAIGAACYLDSFDDLIKALNDSTAKSLWIGPDAPYIVELRDAVARSPDSASKVRAALARHRAADAAALFRMLWGYSADDLKNGADRDLVEGLDNESLDYRVLAFWNLQDITGPATHGYHPSETTFKRRPAVKAWQNKLREGKIVPRSVAPSQ